MIWRANLEKTFSEDPRSYAYHVLAYVQVTNTQASEAEKLVMLLDSLLITL